MSGSLTKIGILGGTFNPIHNGHLMIAHNALEQFFLDRIVFLPTGLTTYKEYKGQDMSRHRLNMLELAIKEDPQFMISRTEIESDVINYTYKTLEKIRAERPDWQLYFILGGDSLRDFETWRNPKRICENAVILAAVREDVDKEKTDQLIAKIDRQYQGTCYRLNSAPLDISSREIRSRIKEGLDISSMVPQSVADYIRNHNLYKNRHEI